MPYLLTKLAFEKRQKMKKKVLIPDSQDTEIMDFEKAKEYHSEYIDRKDLYKNKTRLPDFDFSKDLIIGVFKLKHIIKLLYNPIVKDDDYMVFRFICSDFKNKYSKFDVTPCIMENSKTLVKLHSGKCGRRVRIGKEEPKLSNAFYRNYRLKNVDCFKNEVQGIAHKVIDVKRIIEEETSANDKIKFFNIGLILNNRKADQSNRLGLMTNVVFFLAENKEDPFAAQSADSIYITKGATTYDNGTSCCPV